MELSSFSRKFQFQQQKGWGIDIKLFQAGKNTLVYFYFHGGSSQLSWIKHAWDQEPISLTVFHHDSNLMDISLCYYLIFDVLITTKFCTWHDSCTAMACAKICCDLMANDWITVRWSFHLIWIPNKKHKWNRPLDNLTKTVTHYIDVIMTTLASQTTSLTIVYSTVYSDADQRKHQSSTWLAFVWEFIGTGEFPAQRASYAENVSIWWRHHAKIKFFHSYYTKQLEVSN